MELPEYISEIRIPGDTDIQAETNRLMKEKAELQQKGEPIAEVSKRLIALVAEAHRQFIEEALKQGFDAKNPKLGEIEVKQFSMMKELAKDALLPTKPYAKIIRDIRVRIFGEEMVRNNFDEWDAQKRRRICIATGTRADWGLLSPIAKVLDGRDDVELQIIATNMHLSEKFGSTWKEIERDGLRITRRVPMQSDTDSPCGTVHAMSECLAGMADALSELKPDLLVILGDCYEMLATASAALILRIPIAHIAGGAVSQGAYDESIRHAITKMSHIHLTETEEYRQRVIQLGENPDRVVNTGAIGVYNIMHTDFIAREELEKELGTAIPEKSILITFHPATLDVVPPREQCENLLAALDEHPDYKTIFTYPNNDTNGRVIIELIEDYSCRHPERCAVFPSLGMRRYLSALHCVAAVAGNSSSGIVEVPSMGIPTLNIGIRQDGRTAASSVVNCGVTKDEIARGLQVALSAEMRQKARNTRNPYYQPDTLQKMVKAITETPLDNIIIKPFYDLPQ